MIDPAHIPQEDYEGILIRPAVDRDRDGDLFDYSIDPFEDLPRGEIDQPNPTSCARPTITPESRPPSGLSVPARVSHLIRVAIAGVTSLALAIGILLCLVLWRDK